MNLPDPEAVACSIREKAGQLRSPVDLVRIAGQIPNLVIKELELDGEGLFVDLGVRGKEIYLKAAAAPLRKRFTLAHELGHVVLSEFVLQSAEYRKSKKVKSAIESWCNTFAANLLMPRQEVLQFLRRAKLSGIISALCAGPTAFKVSHQAFRVRACEIAPLSIYVFERSAQTGNLKEYFLSHIRDDLRWIELMDPIVSQMLRNENPGPNIVYTDHHTIVGGYSNMKQYQQEFLAVLLPPTIKNSKSHVA